MDQVLAVVVVVRASDDECSVVDSAEAAEETGEGDNASPTLARRRCADELENIFGDGVVAAHGCRLPLCIQTKTECSVDRFALLSFDLVETPAVGARAACCLQSKFELALLVT